MGSGSGSDEVKLSTILLDTRKRLEADPTLGIYIKTIGAARHEEKREKGYGLGFALVVLGILGIFLLMGGKR